MKILKFGVYLPSYAQASFEHVASTAMLAEKLGFDSVWAADHLVNPDWQTVSMGGNSGKPETLEAFLTLAAVSAKTRRVKLGTCVTPISRSQTPMHLAKTVATLDLISNGRSIFGVGVGWYKKEYLTYGFSWEDFSVRYSKMLEGVQMMKKMWTETPTNYEGRYYKLRGAVLLPKPIQKPHPPIWLGGIGDRMIRAAAMLGDGWISFWIDAKKYKERLGLLRNYAKEFERESAVVPAYATHTYVDPQFNSISAEMEERLMAWNKGATSIGNPTMHELRSSCIVGEPDDCVGTIEKYAEAGVEYIILHPIPVQSTMQCLKMFANKVMSYFV